MGISLGAMILKKKVLKSVGQNFGQLENFARARNLTQCPLKKECIGLGNCKSQEKPSCVQMSATWVMQSLFVTTYIECSLLIQCCDLK